MFTGKLVWNRLRYIKDPATGRRVSRINPREKWIITEVPRLRIVDVAHGDLEAARAIGKENIQYPVHVMTRKSFGLMTRKLSVTE